MLTSKMIPRLPINSCEALFEKLKWDFQQLEKDWASPYTTFNFVVTAYHLYQDWIKRAGSHEQRLRLSQLPETGTVFIRVRATNSFNAIVPTDYAVLFEKQTGYGQWKIFRKRDYEDT